jgi:transcriptional regulator with GAF, ATPase, and Fis domain/tetratricopeptide (TPR) repeat protein
MENALPDFTREQWEFLALLDFFDAPVSVDLIGTLAPLPPGPFLDLIQKGEELSLIRREGSESFGLSSDVPEYVAVKLAEINSIGRLAGILDKLEEIDAAGEISPRMRVRMLAKAGRYEEAARLDLSLATEARGREDFDSSMSHLEEALQRLSGLPDKPEYASEYIDAALQLSNLAFYLGKRWEVLPEILDGARAAAEILGDRRSFALIELHRGRVFYFGGKRHEALTAFSAGWQLVQDLGDADILDRSSGLIGLYFFMQGLFPEALDHLDRAVQLSDSTHDGSLVSPLAPILQGYCALYLGQFHRAVGSLDCSWRKAAHGTHPAQATSVRAVLAMALVHIRNWREAAFHISGAKKEAVETKNDFALYLVTGAEAYRHFLQGRARDAHSVLSGTIARGLEAGLVRQYASPWVLYMLYEFERLGFKPMAGMTFQNQTERILEEPNVHLQGVALRLQARNAGEQREDPSITDARLKLSEEHLLRSGDPVELAWTWLERARLRLREGDRVSASALAKKARVELSGHLEEFYPDDLRYLLEGERTSFSVPESREEVVERFLDMLEALFPGVDPDEILVHTVSASNRLFCGERGGLFWFKRDGPARDPVLRAGCNLTADEVGSPEFEPNRKLVCKAFREGKPVVFRLNTPVVRSVGHQVNAVLCIPFEVEGRLRGVLYHDNSYLNDCFDFLDSSLMIRLARHLTTYVDRILRFSMQVQENSKRVIESTIQMEERNREELIVESPAVLRVLEQADRIADSETTVLILGETGVGKELFARRMHAKSSRSDGPFVVVDLTTIPEGLVESELFGHEKGAFTGADRQKPGRFELADRGTLFIDEVGEIPAPVQAKLLRAIQEKAFYRVGGTRPLRSDFRLVAATNRNLAEEVAARRFREDLYYRINVAALELPPLRKRREDMKALANHFLSHFAKKYNRPWLKLSHGQEDGLTKYQWPGNVRELKNVMERAVVMSTKDTLELDLPLAVETRADRLFADHPTLDEMQQRYIEYTLQKTGGKISGHGGAAELLGMKRSTLNARMRKLGLR